jgi:plastocyanin
MVSRKALIIGIIVAAVAAVAAIVIFNTNVGAPPLPGPSDISEPTPSLPGPSDIEEEPVAGLSNTSQPNNETDQANATMRTTGAATSNAATDAGTINRINILEGSAIQGNPDYDPEELTSSVGAYVSVVNQDTVVHTVTSGTSPQDPDSAQLFDTSIRLD